LTNTTNIKENEDNDVVDDSSKKSSSDSEEKISISDLEQFGRENENQSENENEKQQENQQEKEEDEEKSQTQDSEKRISAEQWVERDGRFPFRSLGYQEFSFFKNKKKMKKLIKHCQKLKHLLNFYPKHQDPLKILIIDF